MLQQVWDMNKSESLFWSFKRSMEAIFWLSGSGSGESASCSGSGPGVDQLKQADCLSYIVFNNPVAVFPLAAEMHNLTDGKYTHPVIRVGS